MQYQADELFSVEDFTNLMTKMRGSAVLPSNFKDFKFEGDVDTKEKQLIREFFNHMYRAVSIIYSGTIDRAVKHDEQSFEVMQDVFMSTALVLFEAPPYPVLRELYTMDYQFGEIIGEMISRCISDFNVAQTIIDYDKELYEQLNAMFAYNLDIISRRKEETDGIERKGTFLFVIKSKIDNITREYAIAA